jgi:hypothetical protein
VVRARTSVWKSDGNERERAENGRREERHLGEKSETSSPSIQLAILLCPQIALFILASDDTARCPFEVER